MVCGDRKDNSEFGRNLRGIVGGFWEFEEKIPLSIIGKLEEEIQENSS
jgi:hypothetical protein